MICFIDKHLVPVVWQRRRYRPCIPDQSSQILLYPSPQFIVGDISANGELVSATTEREVKKATRDLTNLLGGMDNANARVDAMQKKYAELLASQKRLEKENAKNKKRADLIQKEKDSVRSDFTKSNSVKDKLEKLSRELQRENKKLKVRLCAVLLVCQSKG